MKRLIFLLIFIFVSTLNAIEKKEDIKISENKNIQIDILKIKDNLKVIDDELEDNIWITRYNNYLAYRKIENELAKVKRDAKKYARWKGSKYKELSYQLKNKIKIKENELSLISEYKDSPIGSLIKPRPIDDAPVISNPFKVIEGYTYIQKLHANIDEYKETNEQLSDLLKNVNIKIQEYKKLYKINKSKEIKKEIKLLEKELKDFIMVVEIVSTTQEVYSRKIDQVEQEVKKLISNEIEHEIRLIIIISLLFLITLAAKMAMKKYIEDDDKYYTTNKLINFFFIIITLLVLIFSYIENASYLVTFLGFASAGIAIALKDWFMSIFGWISIMTGGHIKPGDRVKVTRQGIEVVGDVLDITLLKMAIREDTTLTAYSKNRRTGRVFFIPNNYVFTDMISNYTFDGLRTVWDVVDISITFDSNHKKAVELAKEVTVSNAKGYTELARKRLSKMRKKYVLRNSNPDPRIFAFIEPHGIVISSWFHTNSHATLGLRSTISMAILDSFKEHDDIQIAYHTQSINITQKDIFPGSDLQNKSII